MGFLQNVQSPQPQSFHSVAAAEQWLRSQGAQQMRDGSYKLSSGLTATVQSTGRGATVSFNGCAC